MNPIETLSEIFAHFPGIGPRQAKRFVYYLLSRDISTIDTFVSAVEKLKAETHQCAECRRYFTDGSSKSICPTCADASRERALLMVVPRDADYDAVEKSGSYKGLYFVLGGSLPILEKEPEKRIRLRELEARIKKNGMKEVILAMNANAEGENTADFLKEKLKSNAYTISELGRGLSTGAELEYADPETLKNALLHRTK